MGREIIIGDVHGCSQELRALLAVVCPTQDDQVIFAGDLLDKGPDCAGVVAIARDLGAILVEGNHEAKHAKMRARLASGKPTTATQAMLDIGKTLSRADVEYLNTARRVYTCQNINGVVVHAGIKPSTRLDMNAGGSVSEDVMYTRYLTPEGKSVQFGQETPSDVFWTASYDGRFGTVFYGHEPRLIEEPLTVNNTVGLDLGCVQGGQLCAATVERNGSVSFARVKSARVYFSLHSAE